MTVSCVKFSRTLRKLKIKALHIFITTIHVVDVLHLQKYFETLGIVECSKIRCIPKTLHRSISTNPKTQVLLAFRIGKAPLLRRDS